MLARADCRFGRLMKVRRLSVTWKERDATATASSATRSRSKEWRSTTSSSAIRPTEGSQTRMLERLVCEGVSRALRIARDMW